jgi:hypothetical protein
MQNNNTPPKLLDQTRKTQSVGRKRDSRIAQHGVQKHLAE